MTESIATYQAFIEFYFKGKDPFRWPIKLYEFFALDNTPPHRMVSIASYYMEGEAWEWFQDAEASGLCTNWVHFICALQDWFWAPIFDASMETTTQESMKEPAHFMPEDQEPILDAPMEAPTQKSTIQESAIQVSVIQESKMLALTILMVLESNEVLRIQEHSKVLRIKETLKIEEPLKT